MFIGQLFFNLFGTKKSQSPEQEEQTTYFQAFILEPILTPSGLIDAGDDSPDPGWIEPITIDPSDFDPLDLPESELESPSLEEIEQFHDSETDLESVLPDDHFEIEDELEIIPYIELEPQSPFNAGVFTVGDTGQVEIDYLFDGGKYQFELAIFSLEGMEDFEPGSEAFIAEAARRALSNSEFGHIVIQDRLEGAKFEGLGNLGENNNWNSGDYLGVKSFSMRPGDEFAFMLTPNGRIQEVLNNPNITGTKAPIFSLGTANPDDMFNFGQIADVTGDGSTFVMEDVQFGHAWYDGDYNDLIFQVRGATGEAPLMTDLIDPAIDWRESDLGQALISYATRYVEEVGVEDIGFSFSREYQPLIGIIDTGFSADNPDLDYSNIMLGRDWIDGDDNPLLSAGEGNEHGTHVLGIIAAQRDNGIGIDGINPDAPIWLGRAVGSGRWADSLVEFVDAAVESGQPNAVVNLSLDLTQIDAEGNVTTRYEFTPMERAAIEYARQNNVLLVVAAGNDGGVMSALGQASQEFDNIITVGAAQQFDPTASPWQGADRADYSSYGRGLDLMTYGGTEENPAFSLSGDGMGTMAGTSVATAKVTGAVSQVWAANPGLSYRQVIEILKQTATDLGETGFDLATGAGLVNMMAAVQLAKATKPQDYDVLATIIPDTWSGEGVFTPGERAVNHPIVRENFSGWVMPTIGVALRNSTRHEDRSGLAEPYQKTLSFDAWTYGERVTDYQLGTPDELWYRVSGTNYWVPSAYIYGFPGSRPPVLAPKTTPTPQPQPQPQPSPSNGNNIINAVNKVNPDQWYYRPRDITGDRINETFCNWFAADVLDQLGVPIPRNGPSAGAYTKPHPIYGTNTPYKPYGTDQLLNFMNRGGDGMWERVSASEAVSSANNGQVVLACSVGHVAVVIPGGSGSNVRIAQAGATNGKDMSVTTGFGNITPTYFRYKGTVKGSVSPNTNTSYSPPATPGQTRQYIVKSGDTLWGIAQRELGDGNRWREIKKANGSTFTEAEARNLQVGQSVYLPVSYQTGTGKPVTPPPNSTPGTTSSINWVNFSGTVGPSIGVNVRNSPRFDDRSSRNEPNGKRLEFDAWTYGETGTDMWTGQADNRWFKIKGTNQWVPSCWIWGNPPSSGSTGSGAAGSVSIGGEVVGNSSKSSDPNGTRGTAQNLDMSKGYVVLEGKIGYMESHGRDLNDYYKFHVNSSGRINIGLDGLSGDADIELLNSSGQVIASGRRSGTTVEAITQYLSFGDYYVRVTPHGSAKTNYNLRVVNLAGPITNGDKYYNKGATLWRFTSPPPSSGDVLSNGRIMQGSGTKGIEAGKDTIVVIHGNNPNGGALDSDSDIISLAHAAVKAYPNHQVLVLDWKGAASNGKLQGEIAPHKSAGAINPVATWAKNTLAAIGLEAKHINIFGHSLGSYVGAEIGRLFGKVNSIVALDPAAAGIRGGGDTYDLNGNTSATTGDGEKVKDFSDVAWNSVAFVASDEEVGWLGDNDRAATADNSFIIRYKDLGNDTFGEKAHNGVVQVFTSMLNRGIYSLQGYKENSIANNGVSYKNSLGRNKHEAVINAKKEGGIWKYNGLSYISGSDSARWI